MNNFNQKLKVAVVALLAVMNFPSSVSALENSPAKTNEKASSLNDPIVEASFPSHTWITLDSSRSINTETYLCPLALDVSSTPIDLTIEKSSLDLASAT